MAETNAKFTNGFLLEDDKVFIPSADINIFPCARRGARIDPDNEDLTQPYDPEARLNTERTNRLHTAINGFKDNFIVNKSFVEEDTTLTFVIAGYRVEVKNFKPSDIAEAFGNDASTIYAYLRLQSGISLDAADYFTDILFRQSKSLKDSNYLDVSYTINNDSNDFFTGISFVKTQSSNDENDYYLPLFVSNANDWELVQTSLLPNIEHGATQDSIEISGDFTVKHGTQLSFKVEKDATVLGPTITSGLIVGEHVSGEEFSNGTIKAKESIEAPTLKVNTITSSSGEIIAEEDLVAKQDISAGRDLTVGTDGDTNTGTITAKKLISTPKIGVDTLTSKSTAADAKISVEKPLLVNSLEVANKTTLSGEVQIDNSLTINGANSTTSTPTLKVNTITSDTAEIAVSKPLKVEDNINVGTPATPATTDNGGYIVAKKDITAEQDLIAKRDIVATGKATVKSLVVGERVDTDSTDPGAITAKKEVKTPKLRVDTITSNNDSILVDDKKLLVTKSLEVLAKNAIDEEDQETPAMATIDKAVIGDLVVEKNDTLNGSTGSITADEMHLNGIGQVPALELANLKDTNIYQLRFKFGGITPIKVVTSFTEE